MYHQEREKEKERERESESATITNCVFVAFFSFFFLLFFLLLLRLFLEEEESASDIFLSSKVCLFLFKRKRATPKKNLSKRTLGLEEDSTKRAL